MVVLTALNEHNAETASADKDVGSGSRVGKSENTMWEIVPPDCLRHWKRRGRAVTMGKGDDGTSVGLTEDQAKGLIRCNGLGGDETNGFFVAYLERRKRTGDEDGAKEEDVVEMDDDDADRLPEAPGGIRHYNGEFRDCGRGGRSRASAPSSDRQEGGESAADKKPDHLGGKKGVVVVPNKGPGGNNEKTRNDKEDPKAAPAPKKKGKGKGKEKSSSVPKKKEKKLAWKQRQMAMRKERLLKKLKKG